MFMYSNSLHSVFKGLNNHAIGELLEWISTCTMSQGTETVNHILCSENFNNIIQRQINDISCKNSPACYKAGQKTFCRIPSGVFDFKMASRHACMSQPNHLHTKRLWHHYLADSWLISDCGGGLNRYAFPSTSKPTIERIDDQTWTKGEQKFGNPRNRNPVLFTLKQK